MKMPPKRARGNGSGSSGEKTAAAEMVEFLNASWTAFHAVSVVAERLKLSGFVQISERDNWASLKPNGRYFFTRNGSTIMAFAIGGKYKPGGGFRIIGAHTDSPCPKLKPVSKQTKSGMLTVNCQPYGGGLWYTWFDRDLSVAGRVVLKVGDKLEQRLVRIDRPIMRIPSLAIHLDRGVNDGFKVNFQNHVAPILATSIKDELGAGKAKQDQKSDGAGLLPQHPLLIQLLCEELQCEPESIVDFELQACDTQPSAIGGAKDEFVYSGRLDNLAMSFTSTKALIESLGSQAEDDCVRVVALFDHEECGSCSAQGAGSPVMMDLVKRVTRRLAAASLGQPGFETHIQIHEAIEISLQKSFLVSADMAHALHPNYSERHEPQHGPAFHKGIVIKHNANQRYATNSITAALFRECARRRDIPFQEFVVRSDMGCGSTIGPIVATDTGMRTVDVGIPQLSMHSIREMCGTDDVDYAVRHFVAFWEEMGHIETDLLLSVDI